MFFILGTSNKDQDGQNENNNGNGAPDGKEVPDGKGGPDDNGDEGSANVTIKKRDGTVIKKRKQLLYHYGRFLQCFLKHIMLFGRSAHSLYRPAKYFPLNLLFQQKGFFR